MSTAFQGTSCPDHASTTAAAARPHHAHGAALGADDRDHELHSPARRPYRGLRGTLPALFTRPLRKPVPDGAYRGRSTARCWWSRSRWIVHITGLYDTHYRQLRASGEVEAVSRSTFIAVMSGMADAADHDTGRGCMTSVGRAHRDGRRTGLCARAERTRRTVQRARALARKLDAITEVMPGRLRTLVERLASWERGDRGRGWTAVYVLHESSLPVDNSTGADLPRTSFGTPPRSGNAETTTSPNDSLPTGQNMAKGRPTGGSTTKRKRVSERAFDRRAILLAHRCRAHPRMPRWIHRHSPESWAAVLTPTGRAGWTADDVVGALADHAITHAGLVSDPRNPHGYLRSILRYVDLAAPPAALDRARAEEEDRRRHEDQARMRAEVRRRNANAASDDSLARRAAVAAIRSLAADRPAE